MRCLWSHNAPTCLKERRGQHQWMTGVSKGNSAAKGAQHWLLGLWGMQSWRTGIKDFRRTKATTLHCPRHLKDSSFIIFDEAQSSLDSANEERLIIAMDDFLENRVFLSIAHRLSSIQNSHRILFMDEGCLVASGTFEELSELHPLFKEKILGEGQG